MSSLTLIVGSIEECSDPFNRLDSSELYYTDIKQDPDNEDMLSINREQIPVRYYNLDKFKLTQFLGSGKTLLAIDIIGRKVFSGGNVIANLGLVWDNEGKPKEDWVSSLNTLEDLRALHHCTVLIDDISATILKWNMKEADIVAEIANAGRKNNLDIIITAQREVQIPKSIRDIATSWLVPIIRIRDYTQETPDAMGYPIELIYLAFDGVKTLKYVSHPLRSLHKLFDAYSTTQRAFKLTMGEGEVGAANNQPGHALECEALDALNVYGTWKHLNGKAEFDIVNDKFAIDVTGVDNDGALILEHKNLLKHIKVSKAKGQIPYLMYKYGGEWRFIRINHSLNDFVEGKRMNLMHLLKRQKSIEAIMTAI